MTETSIDIRTADLAVAGEGTVMKTTSIGSCVVTVLYDPQERIGGMAHAMLPRRRVGDTSHDSPAKYVNESIRTLVQKIEEMGGKKERLTAKLVGGSKMFKLLSGDEEGIGFQNIQSAKETLEELKINIEKEDVGGTIGRRASFNLSNGLVDVFTKM